jgi:hypothetical protein
MQEKMSNRQRKSDELKELLLAIESDDLTETLQNKLELWLTMSSDNLKEVNPYSFMIQEETKNDLLDRLLNAFIELQGCLEAIDEDPFENDWWCPFSCRSMNRSRKLQDLVKQITHSQKSVFNTLSTLKEGEGYDYILRNVENFHSNDFRFYVKHR